MAPGGVSKSGRSPETTLTMTRPPRSVVQSWHVREGCARARFTAEMWIRRLGLWHTQVNHLPHLASAFTPVAGPTGYAGWVAPQCRCADHLLAKPSAGGI